MDEQQLSIFGRQTVINHHVHPLTELPELQTDRQTDRETVRQRESETDRQTDRQISTWYLEVEDASVLSVPEALSMWDNSSQNLLIQSQRGDGSKQPAVTCMDREGNS